MAAVLYLFVIIVFVVAIVSTKLDSHLLGLYHIFLA